MSEEASPYGVSYIASAPEEFKVGDRVEVVDCKTPESANGIKGEVIRFGNDGYIYIKSPKYNDSPLRFSPEELRKLPDTIHFDELKEVQQDDAKFIAPPPLTFERESSVEKFRKITDEMVETYKAKNATYGNAYAEGFNRFGAEQLVSRIYEKYCRVENILVRKADNKVPDESVRDTLTDMAVQCIILRMLLESRDDEFENVI